MRSLIVLLLVVAVARALPHPEYAVIPNDAGNLKLVDLHQEEPESFFDAISDTRFLLYTQNNPDTPQLLELGNTDSIEASYFDPANPTRTTIHGWNGNEESEVNTLLRAAYLQKGDFNIIHVDWSVGADTTLFQTARNRVGAVGGTVAQMLKLLESYAGANPLDMTVIGHNLGGHIAGIAGKNFHEGQGLGNIVALDASNNLFSIDEPQQRVAVGDAVYVESIHTNTGQNGFDQPLGDASFYPNFGNRQPGCGIDVTGNCAHARAIHYFAESINSDRHFWSRQCSRYKDILMEECTAIGVDRKMGGEPVDTLARGIYWTSTNSNSPFATGVL